MVRTPRFGCLAFVAMRVHCRERGEIAEGQERREIEREREKGKACAGFSKGAIEAPPSGELRHSAFQDRPVCSGITGAWRQRLLRKTVEVGLGREFAMPIA